MTATEQTNRTADMLERGRSRAALTAPWASGSFIDMYGPNPRRFPAIPWLADDLGSVTKNGRDHLSEIVKSGRGPGVHTSPSPEARTIRVAARIITINQ